MLVKFEIKFNQCFGSACLILLIQFSNLAVKLGPRWCLARSFPSSTLSIPSVPSLTESLGTHPFLHNPVHASNLGSSPSSSPKCKLGVRCHHDMRKHLSPDMLSIPFVIDRWENVCRQTYEYIYHWQMIGRLSLDIRVYLSFRQLWTVKHGWRWKPKVIAFVLLVFQYWPSSLDVCWYQLPWKGDCLPYALTIWSLLSIHCLPFPTAPDTVPTHVIRILTCQQYHKYQNLALASSAHDSGLNHFFSPSICMNAQVM